MGEGILLGPIRWGSVGPLLLISLAIMGSPGPATISLVAAGSAYGVRRSLHYLVGVIVGSTIVLVAVATGITAALLAVPAIGSVLLWISLAYIVWLAYRIAAAPALSEPAAGTGALSLTVGAPDGLGRHRHGLRQHPPRRHRDRGRSCQGRRPDRNDCRDLHGVACRRQIDRALAPRLRSSPLRQRCARRIARMRDRDCSCSLST